MVIKGQVVKTVDLFCGIGGLTRGLENIGFNVVAGIDNDIACKYGYEASNRAKFIHADINNVKTKEIKQLYKEADVRVLIGCAPCQPFSGLNRYETTPDKSNAPLYRFSKLVKELRPEIVSMENVGGLSKPNKYPVFDHFIKTLNECGYSIKYKVIDASEYGVPQKRKRLVLLASLLGDIDLPKPNVSKKKTVRETIGNLPPIASGEQHSSDPLHRSANVSNLNLTRLRSTPKNGGDSRAWDKSLLPLCHQKESGKSFSLNVYARMRWDEPSPTITTSCLGFGNGRFGHPEQDRGISVREAALLQTFPYEYTFYNPDVGMKLTDLTRFIGNAVPVKLGEIIGSTIKKHLHTQLDLKYY